MVDTEPIGKQLKSGESFASCPQTSFLVVDAIINAIVQPHCVMRSGAGRLVHAVGVVAQRRSSSRRCREADGAWLVLAGC